jgi:hypothetical protein
VEPGPLYSQLQVAPLFPPGAAHPPAPRTHRRHRLAGCLPPRWAEPAAPRNPAAHHHRNRRLPRRRRRPQGSCAKSAVTVAKCHAGYNASSRRRSSSGKEAKNSGGGLECYLCREFDLREHPVHALTSVVQVRNLTLPPDISPNPVQARDATLRSSLPARGSTSTPRRTPRLPSSRTRARPFVRPRCLHQRWGSGFRLRTHGSRAPDGYLACRKSRSR